ncbi:glycosyltransferase [Methanosarcina sp. MSH10X1]|uniref:glycosyltransferase family 4 protein n=1 Tax=Methanosarcina sp. MSH10X1 TaxID=2507075 RepID=UPI000FFC0123|nr:glycosyltransferase family 4 protein [Methanosarcina sp. MSH10X1]RXA20103.1 glycosyltransferase [Methanosarcina sp. MSH10X1]
MRKIVVFNDFPIFPPRFGGQIRIYNIYRNLSRQYNVTYICFGESKIVEETEICNNFLEVRIPKSLFHKNINAVAGKLLGVSVDDISAMFLCRYNRKLDSVAKDYLKDSDLVILSHPYMFPLIKDYAKNKPLVYEAHNVESSLKKSLLGNGLLRNYISGEVEKVESELSLRSDLLFVTSEEDRSSIKKIYGLDGNKIHVSPNGVDTDIFDSIYKEGQPVKERIVDRPLVIFLGSGHPPNVQAAKIIIKEIAPKLKDIYFLICGGVCWGVKDENKGKNVGLTFEVTEEEKLELYRVSDVAINPMVSGSGTNIKMLDYMSASLPVISTPVGARGLNLVNYENVIVCDIPEMPEKIREILLNKELYASISTSGRRVVEGEYNWRIIARNMCRALDKVVD